MTELNLAYFQEREGRDYKVPLTDGDAYPLKLAAVKPKERPIEGWESFTLYFEGPKTGMLGQQTTLLEHEDEKIEVFMVPVEETEDVFVYESVFNRKLEEA